MKRLSQLICKQFIEKRKKESQTTLLSFFPPSERERILDLPQVPQDLSGLTGLEKEKLNWTHYSWFIPFLRGFSEKEMRLFLSALPTESSEKLTLSLKCAHERLELSPLAKSFFQKKMIDFLIGPSPDLLPLAALPKTPLSLLLQLSSEELHSLIELLGLHDLAVELRQIIDNNKLKKIYSLFSPEKKTFLTMLSHKQEPVVFRRMEISRWDGQPDSLLEPLFQRGVNRLAKALYLQSPDFIWYIKHRMDTGTAHMFTALLRPLENQRSYQCLFKQILEAVSFLRTNNPQTFL